MEPARGFNARNPYDSDIACLLGHIADAKSRHAGNDAAIFRSVLVLTDAFVPVDADSQALLASEACDSIWKPPALDSEVLDEGSLTVTKIDDLEAGFNRSKAIALTPIIGNAIGDLLRPDVEAAVQNLKIPEILPHLRGLGLYSTWHALTQSILDGKLAIHSAADLFGGSDIGRQLLLSTLHLGREKMLPLLDSIVYDEWGMTVLSINHDSSSIAENIRIWAENNHCVERCCDRLVKLMCNPHLTLRGSADAAHFLSAFGEIAQPYSHVMTRELLRRVAENEVEQTGGSDALNDFLHALQEVGSDETTDYAPIARIPQQVGDSSLDLKRQICRTLAILKVPAATTWEAIEAWVPYRASRFDSLDLDLKDGSNIEKIELSGKIPFLTARELGSQELRDLQFGPYVQVLFFLSQYDQTAAQALQYYLSPSHPHHTMAFMWLPSQPKHALEVQPLARQVAQKFSPEDFDSRSIYDRLRTLLSRETFADILETRTDLGELKDVVALRFVTARGELWTEPAALMPPYMAEW